MDIVCDKCQSKFRIADEKIAAAKIEAIPCPKCKNRIPVAVSRPVEEQAPHTEQAPAAGEEEAYDAAEKPFDFVEEEGKTALVCEGEPEVRKTIVESLRRMEYHTTEAKNLRDSLKNMRYHAYDLILVDELFDTDNPDANGILTHIERMHMSTRRNLFVVLLTRRFRTMDNMMAFNKSVNLVVNLKNIQDIEKILQKGISENDYFFRVFKETLKKLGRA